MFIIIIRECLVSKIRLYNSIIWINTGAEKINLLKYIRDTNNIDYITDIRVL